MFALAFQFRGLHLLPPFAWFFRHSTIPYRTFQPPSCRRFGAPSRPVASPSLQCRLPTPCARHHFTHCRHSEFNRALSKQVAPRPLHHPPTTACQCRRRPSNGRWPLSAAVPLVRARFLSLLPASPAAAGCSLCVPCSIADM